jgi:hypothetical protein
VQTQDTTNTQDTTEPALKKLALTKETLRRLTPSELRLVAGGLACGQGKHMPDPRIIA